MDEYNNLVDIDYKYLKKIREFIKIFKKELSHCNSNILKENLKTLKIIKRRPLRDGKDIIYASYEALNNVIYIFRGKYIFHELLHMATTVKNKDNIIHIGFACVDLNRKIKIGARINEGYTMLLTNRYFNNFLKSYKYYQIETHFMYMLEIILERNTLEKLYFEADFDRLIDLLLKYNSYENIKSFVFDMDKIYKKENDGVIKNINNFLIETYISKLSIYLESGIIDAIGLENNILKFIDDLCMIKINGKNNLQYIDLDNIEMKINLLNQKYIKRKK
ncbi:MAG: hypothetical protein IJD92_00160 [Bacilli bacterium]|nr:hypothetical protein [Bacilli bacterium]